MKVLVVTNMYPTGRKPHIGTFVKEQVGELRRLGVEVDLVRDHGEGPGALPIAWKYARLAGAAITKGMLKKYDLIHAHYIVPTGTISHIAGGFRRTPVVITSHRGDIYHMPQRAAVLRKMTAWSLERAAGIVAVSKELRDSIVEDYGIDRSKIRTIHMGANTRTFRPAARDDARRKLGLEGDGPQAVFVGVAFERKGGLVLIDALAQIREKVPAGTSVHVVGAKPEKKWIEKAERLGVADLLQFHGGRPHDEIPLWLNGCDLFLLPSYSEGLPISLLEAMAAGSAVVFTPVGGIPSIMRDGENGLLVEPGDVEGLAGAIGRLLTDESLRATLGAEARKTAEENSSENSARQVIEMYEDLV